MHSNLKNTKISIITPTFNQGHFIEQTIISVVGQGYPNLEYIIIDGGSTDDTVDIIKKYQQHISYWVSERDRGQSEAINKGFRIATGDILGWLNSDDLFMPQALATIAETLSVGETEICFGNCIHFKESDSAVDCWGSDTPALFSNSQLGNIDFIIQPSSFWTKKTWDLVGELGENLTYAFDWEWFLRAKQKGVKFSPLSKCLSMYRFHETHKTGTGGDKRQKEILKIYQEYAPRYAHLYELLLDEELQFNSLPNKILGKWLYKTRGRADKAILLKTLKSTKYKDYTTQEIANAILML